jgi:hypothetical protein
MGLAQRTQLRDALERLQAALEGHTAAGEAGSPTESESGLGVFLSIAFPRSKFTQSSAHLTERD